MSKKQIHPVMKFLEEKFENEGTPKILLQRLSQVIVPFENNFTMPKQFTVDHVIKYQGRIPCLTADQYIKFVTHFTKAADESQLKTQSIFKELTNINDLAKNNSIIFNNIDEFFKRIEPYIDPAFADVIKEFRENKELRKKEREDIDNKDKEYTTASKSNNKNTQEFVIEQIPINSEIFIFNLQKDINWEVPEVDYINKLKYDLLHTSKLSIGIASDNDILYYEGAYRNVSAHQLVTATAISYQRLKSKKKIQISTQTLLLLMKNLVKRDVVLLEGLKNHLEGLAAQITEEKSSKYLKEILEEINKSILKLKEVLDSQNITKELPAVNQNEKDLEIENLKKEIKLMKGRLSTQEMMINTNGQQSLQLMNENSKLDSMVRRLHKEKLALEEKYQNLYKVLEEHKKDNFKAKYEDSQKQLEEIKKKLDSERNNSEKNAKEAQKNALDNRVLQSQFESLKKDNQLLQADNINKANEIAKLRNQASEIANLKAENEKLTKEIQNLKAQQDEQAQDLKDQNQAQINELNTKIEQLLKKQGQLEYDNYQLGFKLLEANTALNEKNDNTELEAQFIDIAQDALAMAEKIQELEKANEGLTSRNFKLHNMIVNYEDQIEDLKETEKKFEELKSKYLTVHGKLKHVKSQLDIATGIIKDKNETTNVDEIKEKITQFRIMLDSQKSQNIAKSVIHDKK